MTFVLNVLWFILGGWLSGLSWLVAALLLAVTVVGLPWAIAAARIGLFSFAPFGRRVTSRREVTGRDDLGTGPLGLVLNLVWLVLGGWYVALLHVLIGLAILPAIITIPFSIQHFKLARIAFAPVGTTVVDT
jgi:uncharacterized membrane protein YccF (DUF307 family)